MSWRVELSSVGELEVSKFEFADDKLVVEPLFYGKGASANLTVMRVYNGKNQLISTSIIGVSGINAKPLIRTFDPVPPQMEREKKQKKAQDGASPASGNK